MMPRGNTWPHHLHCITQQVKGSHAGCCHTTRARCPFEPLSRLLLKNSDSGVCLCKTSVVIVYLPPQEWAVAESRAKNFTAARELFGRALALNPRHVPALTALAQTEACAGQLQAARNLYARALQVSSPAWRSIDCRSQAPSHHVVSRMLCSSEMSFG